jgi:acyl-homoserine-lactone acylase
VVADRFVEKLCTFASRFACAGGRVMLVASVVLAAGHSAGAADSRSVRLYRDQYGMAHLYADKEEDGFYGLGYAVAEDRLREVLTWYLAVRGELAATFGKVTPPPLPDSNAASIARDSYRNTLADSVTSDRNALKYKFLVTARRNLRKLPAQYRKDLQGYIDGLRAFMREHPQRTPEWAPTLEPALPLAMFDLMVLEAHGVCDSRREADRNAEGHRVAGMQLPTTQLPFGGSNAWAVAGDRTADGGTFLESDSHNPIESYGTLFYPYRIKAGGFDFMGFDPAGTVMFFFGHSPFFAWGDTEGPRFVADCYRITTDAHSPRRYLFDGKTRTISAEPYGIAIKGAPTEVGTFEYTHHNGVRSPVETREANTAYVVSYASAERVGLAAAQYYVMAMARNRAQLETALARRDAYPANTVIAGADGTIMYIRGGRIPIRPSGLNVRGTLDGNTSATAWRGIHSYDEALKLTNPPQGYVANCNISPDMMYPTSSLRAADFPEYFAFEPGLTNARQQRLIELLDPARSLSVNGAESIAMDETIPSVRAWGPAIARLLAEEPAELMQEQPAVRSFLEELAEFDGTFSKESRGALDHFELRRALSVSYPNDVMAISDAIETGSRLSAAQEQVLMRAAAEARTHIIDTYGRTDLTWGDVHRVGRGNVDFAIGGARLITGAKVGGVSVESTRTLRALSFEFDPVTRRERLYGGQRIPFLVHFTRAGVQSYAESLWGISDDPSSPHYSDQAQLASDKKLRPIPLTEAELVHEHASLMSLKIRRH